MNYMYYPGCSLDRNAISYHSSTLAVAKRLGMQLQEIDDWNCCGATEYMALDLLPAHSLIARNLALAADQSRNGAGMVAPCSACYLNLTKTNHYMAESKEMEGSVNEALSAGGLHYQPDSIRIRHLLQVLIEDIGYEKVAEAVKRPLNNLRIAPYYGCLVVRPPYGDAFDDPEYPTSLDRLMGVLGAEVVDYPVKTHCCGGHMTQISESVALELIRILLKVQDDHEADVIVTLCPMCQLNLDGYQDAVNKRFGTKYKVPILYFTQVIGLALGASPEELGIGKEFVSARKALKKIDLKLEKKPKKKRPTEKELPMAKMPEEG